MLRDTGSLSAMQADVTQASSAQSAAAAAAALAAGTSPHKDEQTTAHLQRQVLLSVMLQDSAAYLKWLSTFVRHLAKVSDVARLRALCNDLLTRSSSASIGDAGASAGVDVDVDADESGDAASNAWFVGVSGVQLVQDTVLPAIAAQAEDLSMQRLAGEVKAQLPE